MKSIKEYADEYIRLIAGDKSASLYNEANREPSAEEGEKIRFIKAAYELSEVQGLFDDKGNTKFSFINMITNGEDEYPASRPYAQAHDIIEKYNLFDNNSHWRENPSFPNFCMKAFHWLPKEKRKQAMSLLVGQLKKPQEKITPKFLAEYDKKKAEEDKKVEENMKQREREREEYQKARREGRYIDCPTEIYRPNFPKWPSVRITVDPDFFSDMIVEYCREKGYTPEQAKLCLQGFLNDPKKLEKGNGLVQRLVKAKEADVNDKGENNRKNALSEFLKVSAEKGKEEAKKVLKDFHNDSTALVKRRTAVKSLKEPR